MNDMERGFIEKQFNQTGFAEAFTQQLVEQLKALPPVLQHSFSKRIDNNEVNANLVLKKSDQSNLYFLNRVDMKVLKDGQTEPVQQSFPVHKDNKYTLKESYNLLMGRSVYKTHTNKQGEQYQAWSKVNFNNQLANGNYEIKQYNDQYGFKLENVLAKYPIKELATEHYKASLMSSLHRGNLQSVTFVGEGGKEEKLFIAPNIALGSLNVYTPDKQRLTTEQLVEKNFIGKDLAEQLTARLELLKMKQESMKETVQQQESPAKQAIAKEKKLVQKPERRQRQKIKS